MSSKRSAVQDDLSSNKRATSMADATSYNSDEEPPPVAQNPVRNWRLDPEESLSDWAIEIVVNDKTYATYHVHKVFLAVGPRRSEYFVKLFSEGGRFSESKNTTSHIKLEEIAAESFPILLDYLYSEVVALPLDTSNATALHSMAKYFDIRRLRWEVKQFWQKDIKSADTCGTYYEHARILKDDKILKAAIEACSQNIMQISQTSRLVNVSEPSFWLEMLKNKPNSVSDEQFSCHMSTLIAKFAECHKDLESEMLKNLTDSELLPHIHCEAALPLINIERQIVAASDEVSLSCLQWRCIAALVQNWGKMDLQSQGSVMMELCQKQSPVVLAEILAGTLSAAKQDTAKLESEVQSKQALLEKQSQELQKFHRFVSFDGHSIENGSVTQSSLPEHVFASTSGANLRLNYTSIYRPGHTRTKCYPLFYYRK